MSRPPIFEEGVFRLRCLMSEQRHAKKGGGGGDVRISTFLVLKLLHKKKHNIAGISFLSHNAYS